jgi:hypothetical protein
VLVTVIVAAAKFPAIAEQPSIEFSHLLQRAASLSSYPEKQGAANLTLPKNEAISPHEQRPRQSYSTQLRARPGILI